MSLGAMIAKRGVDEAQLLKDIEAYGKMVDEAVDTLAYYENKDEGLAHLTKKASEEYEKMMKEIEEGQKKSRRLSMITNIAFILGFILLLFFAMMK